MKYSLLAAIFNLLFATDFFAQTDQNSKYKNETILTVGSSASLFSKVKFANSDSIYRSQTTPPINLCLDFASKKNVTFGLAFYYENVHFNRLVKTGSVRISSKGTLFTRGSYSENAFSFTRLNPAVRFLTHQIRNDYDFYAGARIGYEFYVGNTTHFALNTSKFTKATVQLLLGFRKFVGKWGFNTEAAIGKPFWLAAGLNYKLNTYK